ncbi:glycoside hydrolase superfamily [Mrakia frigida]|uniref:17-beta-hydroxysteroid dehydrogenase-like protein n=1 Tax=Mrakia frigida TaxID=29902 RepID=UPI003FCC070E
MFSKLANKFSDKLNLHDSSNSNQQQQPFQSQGGGGNWSRTVLGTGSKAEIYRHRYWRGVNLGSWFTLEPWITSHPFRSSLSPGAHSDLDIVQSPKLSLAQKKALLEKHWDEWIGEEDFKWLKGRGINTVRLPIGYYHLAGLDRSVLRGTEVEFAAEVFEGAWERILRGIRWAEKHGMGVLIDLHAASGKQNPEEHSGASHPPYLFNGPSAQANQIATVNALVALVRATHKIDNVVGLELLNEPQPNPALVGWQKSTIRRLREEMGGGGDYALIVGDAWNLSDGLKQYFPDPDFTVLDTHVYRCFTDPDKKLTPSQHAEEIKSKLGSQLEHEGGKEEGGAGGRVIVGEWSGALNPDSFRGSQGGEQDAQRRVFVRAELEVWDKHTSGYFFWTLKKDEGWDAGWNFKNACQAEIVPSYLGSKAKSGVRTGEELMRNGCEVATANHSNYWDGVMKGKKRMEHERFREGYVTGWSDSLHFLTSPHNAASGTASEIPVAGGQWKVRRREEHVQQRGGGEFVWEWEHGFNQGRQEAKEAWERA